MPRGNLVITCHKIERKIETDKCMECLNSYKQDKIRFTDHSLFRFKENQRNIFKDKVLKYLTGISPPILAGVQYNGCWVLFYKDDKDILKIIVDFQLKELVIVSIYMIDESQVPKM